MILSFFLNLTLLFELLIFKFHLVEHILGLFCVILFQIHQIEKKLFIHILKKSAFSKF